MPAPPPPQKEGPPLAAVTGSDLPVFRDDLDRESLARAVRKSLEYYARLPERTTYRMAAERFTVRDMKESLEAFLKIVETSESPASIERRVRETFDVYRASGSGSSGSAFYRLLRAGPQGLSRAKRAVPLSHLSKARRFRRCPAWESSGINTAMRGWSVASRTASWFPISTREEIDGAGVLENRGLEIAWFADPVDIFFLHIQGSGMICLPDGACFQVSYAQSNGRAYRSIGKLSDRFGQSHPG